MREGRTTASSTPAGATTTKTATPEQMTHLFAVRERLSPTEQALVEHVIKRMPPEMLMQYLGTLSAMSIDEATAFVEVADPRTPGPKALRSRADRAHATHPHTASQEIENVISSPINDHACLGPTTEQIRAEVEAANPALVELTERFANTDDLASGVVPPPRPARRAAASPATVRRSMRVGRFGNCASKRRATRTASSARRGSSAPPR